MNRYSEVLKEAKLTMTALVALIIFWLLAGIIGRHVEISICSVPMWAIFGTVGVWTSAIVIAITLSRSIKNTDL